MLDVQVIDKPEVAQLALDPIRGRILAALATPGSAASLAGRLNLPRQKVNYHLRVLEEQKLVSEVEARQWGGLTERMMEASALSYVVSPLALGPLAADPAKSGDRLSATYLIALASRVVSEVGDLWCRALKANRRLATLSIDVELSFKSPADRARFTEHLAKSVAELVAAYHHPSAPGARPHRLVVASYPTSHRKD